VNRNTIWLKKRNYPRRAPDSYELEWKPDPLSTSVGPSFTARKRSSRRKKDEISISKKRRIGIIYLQSKEKDG
jgi:hypothetical protein